MAAFKKYLFLLFWLLVISSSVFAFSIKTGYYVGTGNEKSISGLGFQPDLVIIKPDTAGGYAVWRSSAMSGDKTAYFSNAAVNITGFITSLDSDGFSIGTNPQINSNTVRYSWTAFGGSGGGDFKVGVYTGDSSDNRNITGIGFQPDLVWVKRDGATAGAWLTSVMTPDATSFFTAIRQASDAIQVLNADGFQVGTSAYVNASGVYYYVAFKASSNLAVGSYDGIGSDNRSITISSGFKPEFCFLKSTSIEVAVLRNDRSYGDETQYFSATANAVNNIQSIEASGFQVGTDIQVNGVGRKYYYAGFKGASVVPPSSVFKMRTGSYTGNGASQSISTPGFNPQYIMVKSDETQWAAFVTPYTGYNNTAYFAYASAGFAEGIISSDEDGFTLGSGATINSTDVRYRWVAFSGDASTNFITGAYTGTGGDNRSITGLGFQPDFVAVKANGGYLGVFRTSSMAGDTSAYYTVNANTSNLVQALESDGFQLGSSIEVNAAGVLYDYVAFKETSGQFDVGSYTGNGADDRPITGLGFRPGSTWVKRTAASAGVFRSNNVSGDWSHYFINAVRTANLIQSLDSDGFQVGSNVSVNNNLSTYHYASWKASPSILTFEVNPASTTAGQVITPGVQVAVLDSLGNIDAADNSTTVSITIESNPSSGVLSGTFSKTVASGVATFNDLSINKAGNGYTLRISATDLDPATSESFNITAATATYFGVTGEATTTAGGPKTTTVTAYDEFGNLATGYTGTKTLIFAGARPSSNPVTNPTCRNAYGTDEAFGTASVINFSSGVATALMKLYSAEAAHICASQEAIGTPTSLMLTVEVSAAVKNKLGWDTLPATSVYAGATWNPFSLEILDAYGNRTADTSSIYIHPSICSLEGTPVKAAIAGLANFTDIVYYDTAEALTISATADGVTASGASDLINIHFATVEALKITGSATMSAGSTQTITVLSCDLSGNPAINYNGDRTLVFSGANPSTNPTTEPTCLDKNSSPVAFGSDTLLNFVRGRATTAMKLYKSESALVSATQGTLETTIALTVEVSGGAKNRLEWIVQPPSSVMAGTTWESFSVGILDAYGNRTFDPSSVIISPSVCSLEGTTNRAAVLGVASFSDISYYDTAEVLTLSASSDGVTGPGTSGIINIHFATVEALKITGTATMSAGTTQTITIQACDQNGNPVINYLGDKTLVFSGANLSPNPTTEPTCRDKNGSAIAFGSDTLINFSRGVATSAMKLYKAESALIKATQGTLETPTANALSVEVIGGAKNRIEWVVQPPSSVIAGASWDNFSAGCLDAYGNRSMDSGTMTLSSSLLFLSGTLTQPISAGIATFENVSCVSIGTTNLTATTEGAITSESSSPVIVGFGPKYSLGFRTQPSTAEINATIIPSVEVTIKNPYGIVITNENSTEVILAINNNPGSGLLSGTTAETSVAGISRFADLSIDKWGSGYTLIASAEGLIPAVSNGFNINRVSAAKLAIIVQPSNALAGNIITPEVRVAVEDRFGNLMDEDNTTRISVSLQNNPSSGSIFGTLTQTASAGVVAFNDLYINKSGSNYTLLVSAEGLTIATSDAFSISGEMPRPTILSISPSQDAINVTTEAVIQAQFSQNMDRSVTLNAFSLKAIRDNSGNSIDIIITGTATLDSLARNFAFTPAASLTKGYTYLASFDATARNADLITLLSAESWSFLVVLDHTRENTIYSGDRNAYVDLGTQTLPFDGSVAINRSPRTAPLYVDPAAITAAINKVLAEGNPFHYPVEPSITEFALYDASGTHVATRFAESAILALHYDDVDGDGFVDNTTPALRETDLLLYRLDETNSLWVRVPDSSVNTTSNFVYAPVNSFSVYTIMSTPAQDLSSAYSFPNPFKPSSGHTTITFTNLAAQCTIRVYTISGEIVKTIQETDGDGQKTWDVKNESGESLRSGLYLFVISSSGDTKKGKLVVVR